MKKIGIIVLSFLLILNTSVIFADTTIVDGDIEMTLNTETLYGLADGSDQVFTIPVAYVEEAVAIEDADVLSNEDLTAYIDLEPDVILTDYEAGEYSLTLVASEVTDFTLVFQNGEASAQKMIHLGDTDLSVLSNRYAYFPAGGETFQGEYMIHDLGSINPEDITIEVLNSSDEAVLDPEEAIVMTIEEVTPRDYKLVFSGSLPEGDELLSDTYTVNIEGPIGTVSPETVVTEMPIIEGVELVGLNDDYRSYQLTGFNMDAILGLDLDILDGDSNVDYTLQAMQLVDFEHAPILLQLPNVTEEDYTIASDDIVFQPDTVNALPFDAAYEGMGPVKLAAVEGGLEITLTGMNLTEEGISELELSSEAIALNLLSYGKVAYASDELAGWTFTLPFEDVKADMSLLKVIFDSEAEDFETVEIPNLEGTPVITVENMTEGMTVNDSITPEVESNVPMILEATLDGEAYTLDTEITTKGEHVLMISGEDYFGNPAEALTINFTLQHTPVVDLKAISATYGETKELKADISGVEPLEGIEVKFYIDNVLVGTVVTDEDGTAKMDKLMNYTAGLHTMKAVTTADAENFLASASDQAALKMDMNTSDSEHGFVEGGGRTALGQFSLNIALIDDQPLGHFNYQVKHGKGKQTEWHKYKSKTVDNMTINGDVVLIEGSAVRFKAGEYDYVLRIDVAEKILEVSYFNAEGIEVYSETSTIRNGNIHIH